MPVTTNTITGTAQGVSDTLFGTHANDRISGLSGDDVIYAGRGDDVVIGGQGNDVMVGGLGADEFQFSAGHIGDGEVDYITDFSLRFGDTLNFLDSANGTFEVLSIERDFLDETTANGVDLKNNVNFGTDVTFTVRNSENGNTQEIVLLDSYAFSLRAASACSPWGRARGHKQKRRLVCTWFLWQST